MTNLILLYTFFKFGALCFGGGYVIIPMLLHTYVEEEHLFNLAEFGNLISISQLTPGPVSINTATFVGFIKNGVWGAIFASVGLILPTLILSSCAIGLIKKYKDTFVLKGMLSGTRLAAMAMIMYACLIFMQLSVFSTEVPWKEIFSFSIKKIGETGFHINPIETLIAGLSFYLVYKNKISITKLLFIALILGGLGAWIISIF